MVRAATSTITACASGNGQKGLGHFAAGEDEERRMSPGPLIDDATTAMTTERAATVGIELTSPEGRLTLVKSLPKRAVALQFAGDGRLLAIRHESPLRGTPPRGSDETEHKCRSPESNAVVRNAHATVHGNNRVSPPSSLTGLQAVPVYNSNARQSCSLPL